MLQYVNKMIGIAFVFILLSSCHVNKKRFGFDHSYFDMINNVLSEKCCDSLSIGINKEIQYNTMDDSEYNVSYWLNKRGIQNLIFKEENNEFVDTLSLLEAFKKNKKNSYVVLNNGAFSGLVNSDTVPFQKIAIFNSSVYIDNSGKGVFFLCIKGTHFFNYLVFVTKSKKFLSIDSYVQLDTDFPWK